MTESEFKTIGRGDLIRHKHDPHALVVESNDGRTIIAVRVVHVCNPPEWDLISRANHEEKLKEQSRG